jgi:pimeloyl-ACP methyl ester carboxylesterase
MKALTLTSWAVLLLGTHSQEVPDIGSFDWEAIEPSYHLKYHACYDNLQCARLKVPLDWLDANNTNTVAIAILKKPAVVPESDPRHGGSILVNPGGPGGSGVVLALSWAGMLQNVVDSDERHYEIVGFDPRGVMFTTPPADCYFDELARGAYLMQVRGAGGLVPDPGPLSKRSAMTSAWGRLCGESLGGEGGILPFASTASVARDMVEMVDKIEELRQKEKRQARARDPSQKPVGGDEMDEKSKSPARLQYLGFSYGTVLGNTFASMFPGRVGRLVLDGVCDIDDYMDGVRVRPCSLTSSERPNFFLRHGSRICRIPTRLLTTFIWDASKHLRAR